jgi:hypothetical protein
LFQISGKIKQFFHITGRKVLGFIQKLFRIGHVYLLGISVDDFSENFNQNRGLV